MRNITIKAGIGSEPKTYKSAAKNLSELKKEVTDIQWSGQSVLIKETRTQVTSDVQAFPDTDCTLLLSPSRMKAGDKK